MNITTPTPTTGKALLATAIALAATLSATPAVAGLVVVGNPSGPPLATLDGTSVPDQFTIDLDNDGNLDLQFGQSGSASTVQASALGTSFVDRPLLIASTTPAAAVMAVNPFDPPNLIPIDRPALASELTAGSLVGPATPFDDSSDGSGAGTEPFRLFGIDFFESLVGLSPTGEFQPGAAGFFGFAFESPDGLGSTGTLYGYGQVTITGSASTPIYTVDYFAYETSGAAIEVGAIPEPATLGLLGATGLLLASRRRRD